MQRECGLHADGVGAQALCRYPGVAVKCTARPYGMRRACAAPRLAGAAHARCIKRHAPCLHRLPILLGNYRDAAMVDPRSSVFVEFEDKRNESFAAAAVVPIAGTAGRACRSGRETALPSGNQRVENQRKAAGERSTDQPAARHAVLDAQLVDAGELIRRQAELHDVAVCLPRRIVNRLASQFHPRTGRAPASKTAAQPRNGAGHPTRRRGCRTREPE